MLKVKVYQADIEWINKFRDYEFIMNHGGIDACQYKRVFDGEVDVFYLEDIFVIFNTRRPEGFVGHSMSVSDIIQVEGNGFNGTYMCDSFGFTEIHDFKED